MRLNRPIIAVLTLCLLATSLAAGQPEDPVAGVMAAADQYAAELMAAPPDDLTKGEIALAFGWIYLFEMLGKSDRDRAERYLHIALDDGLTEAGVVLGALNLGGREYGGGERDLAAALDYYRRAADAGSVDAARMLGILYPEGDADLPADAEKGRHYLLEAAARGSATALEALRAVLAEDPEWKDRLADPAGADEALETLVDPELARRTRERAERVGKATARVFVLLEQRLALLELGVKAGSALGAAEDGAAPGGTDFWRELDANIDAWTRDIVDSQPDPKARGDAALMIGIFHYMGLFSGIDMDKAREFMEMALELGVPEAKVTLGELHLGFAMDEAEATERDIDKALGYLNAAASEDHVDALRLLGLVYADGVEGVPADADKAEQYFLRAARHGDAEALSRLEPVFARAEEWNRAHPGEKSPLPASAPEAVDSALAEAAAKRSEELGRVAEMINRELDRRTREMMERGKQ